MQLADLNLTVQSVAFRILALVIIAGVHGVAVAAAAVWLGDRGPRYDGRLTPGPAGHIDLVGGFCLVVFGLGWTRPVAVDARQFRVGRPGILVVILAGFLGLLAAAALLQVLIVPALTTLPHSAALTTAAFLRTAGSLMVWVALFSLVPIPPLTGGLLPRAYGIAVPRQAEWILVAVLVVAVATGVARYWLGPAHDLLIALLLGL